MTASRPVDAARVEAFQALAERHLFESYQLANAILAQPMDAQDAVQDAFLEAWEGWSSIREPGSLEPWFRRILVNVCRDRLRRAARRLTVDMDAIDAEGLGSPDGTTAVHARDQVERALTGLGPDDRVVLALRYYRDLRIEDIAAILGVPPGTVTSRLHRAHLRLRAILLRSEKEPRP
ncbi:N/A [soil metagenome]